MLARLGSASFLTHYFPFLQTDVNALSRTLRLTALLVFLGERAAGGCAGFLWGRRRSTGPRPCQGGPPPPLS